MSKKKPVANEHPEVERKKATDSAYYKACQVFTEHKLTLG
jgi:hypothetical protein